jgi:hypothetical protein
LHPDIEIIFLIHRREKAPNISLMLKEELRQENEINAIMKKDG